MEIWLYNKAIFHTNTDFPTLTSLVVAENIDLPKITLTIISA